MMIVGILFIVAIVALFALAFAFVLSIVAANWSVRRRVALAAFGAGFIPTFPALFTVGMGMDGSGGSFIPVIAILIGSLFLTIVIGFPTAYAFTRRSEAKRNPPVEPNVFE